GRRGANSSSGSPNSGLKTLLDISLSSIAEYASIKITHEHVNINFIMHVGLGGLAGTLTNDVKYFWQMVRNHQFLKMTRCICLTYLLNHIFSSTACSSNVCQSLQIYFCSRNMGLHTTITDLGEL